MPLQNNIIFSTIEYLNEEITSWDKLILGNGLQ